VLSGVTTEENLEEMIERSGLRPDYVLEHLGKLFE
jgi:hypothetical protein